MNRHATAGALLVLLLASGCARAEQKVWREIQPGLEVAHFDSRAREAAADGDLVVVRVDVRRCGLRVLQAAESGAEKGLTPAAWAEKFGLSAVINAGMYQEDHRTHVGFSQIDGKVTNPSVNDYLSALAIGPVAADDPAFRLFDLDETPLREVRARYRTVVQNLRLVKRARENRWQPLGDRWSEAALGEDAAGRALLIHCRTAWSMYDFNEILLALPLDLVAAQHLEGRRQAQIWLREEEKTRAGDRRPDVGSGPVLPNVIGVPVAGGGE